MNLKYGVGIKGADYYQGDASEPTPFEAPRHLKRLALFYEWIWPGSVDMTAGKTSSSKGTPLASLRCTLCVKTLWIVGTQFLVVNHTNQLISNV